MNKVTNITTVILAALVLAGLALFAMQSQTAMGSVITGGEYQATVLTSADTGTSTVRTLFGSVGSVVISSSSPTTGQPIRIFNTASTTVATSSLTAVIEIYPQTDEGTYTYDVAFGTGVMVDVPEAYNGSAVLTTR